MRYIDADRLIKYLEKEADKEFKKTEENANSPVLCHFHNGCRMQALDTIDFIKQLQQEQSCDTCTNDKGCVTCKDGELWEGKEQPCEDLEEEIKRYIPREQCPVPDFMEAVARHFANWQKAQMLKEMAQSNSPLSVAYANRCFENGKQAMKEEMLKDAVEADIKLTLHDKTGDLSIHTGYLPKKLGIKYGDKVKIIIVKEDKK